MDAKNFRERLQERGHAIGMFAKALDPSFIEAAGYAGLDFVILDMEHGPANHAVLIDLIRAAELGGALPIVRVPEGNVRAIGEVLDLGAGGVQVPQVSSAAAARQVVDNARFHPFGSRGLCRFVRAAQHSHLPVEQHLAKSRDNLIVVHIEGSDAVANLEEILDVDGIDVVFIGPYDLSQSLGIPGQTTHPRLQEAIKSIVETGNGRGKSVGLFVEDPESAARWIELGVAYIAYSVDIGIFLNAVASIRHEIDQRCQGFDD